MRVINHPLSGSSISPSARSPWGAWPLGGDPLGPPHPHPISDATFGSDTARHADSDTLGRMMPKATAACCRAHGVIQHIHSEPLIIKGHGPTLRGLMMATCPLDLATATVVLFLGGCGAPAAASAAAVASGYMAQGATLCVVDYRGFGQSAGAPDEMGLYEDGARMLRHLTDVLGVPVEHIVLHGYAMGATVAAELAARWSQSSETTGPSEAMRRTFGGLVLDRPMASVMAPVHGDQGTGLGYLSGLLSDEEDDTDPDAHHISHKLERIDPNTYTVLLCGDKDSLGVSGEELQHTLDRCGFHVEQAHLYVDTAAGGYDLFSCAEGCLSKLCRHIAG